MAAWAAGGDTYAERKLKTVISGVRERDGSNANNQEATAQWVSTSLISSIGLKLVLLVLTLEGPAVTL